MMKKIFTLAITVFLMLLMSPGLLAQISQGGTPPSFLGKAPDDNVEVIRLDKPDMQKIHEEDAIADNESINPPRMGVSVTVNKGIHNAGTWTELEEGGKIWRLTLTTPDALAQGVYYENFYLPEGGELYLYNKDRKHLIGAFTSYNNRTTGLFATQFIQGDEVTLEYYQPDYVNEEATFNITEIAYAYRYINFELVENGERDAWWCMINVACEEADDYRNELKGVTRISLKIGGGYGWCSGSLINNTSWDRTPYVLTASHCGYGASSSDLNQWVFYFNYEASSCDGTWGPSNQSVTGASLKAWDHMPNSNTINHSDFYLVELNANVPSSYDPFYNGWDRRNIPAENGGVSIHHPSGDIKKISTYETMVSSPWTTSNNTHWRVWWIETANGKSIIQPGSSGSPVFSSEGHIMGDLTGHFGTNTCESPSSALYGKIYWSWDKAGSSPSYRLKDWLDPEETEQQTCPGISWEDMVPDAEFSSSDTLINQGDVVYFYDSTTNTPTEWTWIFEGALYDTLYDQNPENIYQLPGYHNVKLIASNPDGTDSVIKEDYIHVIGVEPPTADFDSDTTFVEPFGSVDFYDMSTNDPTEWHWYFEGGTPDESTEQNPEEVKYYASGLYDVSLVASNAGGQDSIMKEDYINVVYVGVDEDNLLQNVKIYPNPAKDVVTVQLSNIDVQKISIDLFNLIGKRVDHYEEVNENGLYRLNLSNQPEGMYIISLKVNDVQSMQRISLIR